MRYDADVVMSKQMAPGVMPSYLFSSSCDMETSTLMLIGTSRGRRTMTRLEFPPFSIIDLKEISSAVGERRNAETDVVKNNVFRPTTEKQRHG